MIVNWKDALQVGVLLLKYALMAAAGLACSGWLLHQGCGLVP